MLLLGDITIGFQLLIGDDMPLEIKRELLKVKKEPFKFIDGYHQTSSLAVHLQQDLLHDIHMKNELKPHINEQQYSCNEKLSKLETSDFDKNVEKKFVDVKKELLVDEDGYARAHEQLQDGLHHEIDIKDEPYSFSEHEDNVEEYFKDCDQFTTVNTEIETEAHKRISADEKTYQCCTCDKRFFRGAHLNRHMRAHTGEKPFKCNSCEQRFTQRSDIKRHMLTHTGEKPFRCGRCGKLYTRSCVLKMHMRTHTGEKPFKCDSCGKQFTRAVNLNLHIRIHSNEKSFSSDC